MAKKVLFRLALVLALVVVSSCSDDDGGGGGEDLSRPLGVDLDGLADRYAGVDPSTVVEVPFDEILDLPSSPTRAAPAGSDLVSLEGSGWIRLFREDPLEPVPGSAFAASGGRRLLYVPTASLEPGAAYRVVLSSEIRAVSGRSLGEDLSFPVTVAEDGRVVRVISSPSLVTAGTPVRFSAGCASGVDRVTWTFDTAAPGSGGAEGTEVEHTYDREGAYRVEAEVTDPYGRTFTGEAEVTVLPDLERKLSANPLVRDVEVLSAEDLEDRSLLEKALGADPVDVLSVAEARIGPEGVPEGVPVAEAVVRPETIPDVVRRFAEEAAREGRFLGVVRFFGIPAVLAGGCDGDRCTLDLLLDKGAFRFEGTLGGREIHVDEPALSPVPTVYAVSFVVGPETVETLRSLLAGTITEPLCRLRLEVDNSLRLEVPVQVPRRLGMVSVAWGGDFVGHVVGGVTSVVSEVGDAVGEAVEAGEELVESIWDFIAGDEIDLLGSLAGLASELADLSPLERAEAVGEALSSLYDALETLADSFSEDPAGMVSAYTDPEVLIEDLSKFVDGNGGNDLSSLFRRTVDRLNGSVDALGTNPFEAMADLLASGSGLADLLGDLSADEDAEVVLSVGSSSYLQVRQGSSTQTFTLGELDAWPVDEFLEQLPDFPLTDLVSALSGLADEVASGLRMEMALAYEARTGRFCARYAMTSGSDELYAFDAYLSGGEGAGIELRVNDPLDPDVGITVHGALPGVSTDPLPEGTAGALLESLYTQATAFPELSVEMRARYREMLATVNATTRPQVSFGVGLSVGFEVNYHVVVGGKVAGSIGISASMDAGDALDSLTDLLKSAFDAARGNLGLDVEIDDGVPMVSFPDEDALMGFLDDLLGRLETQAPELFDKLQVAISASAEVGVGVGAGGTGTGGAGADLAGKMGIEVGASAADMYRIASFCVEHGSALLFSGLTDQLARFQNAGGVEAVFDMDAIPELFRGGLEALMEEVSPTELDDFFHTLATGLAVTLSVSVGADAEAEEVVSGGVDLDTGIAVSGNGELLLNGLLDSFRVAASLAGLDGSALYDRLKVLDQPAVFPEIRFSALPIQADLSAGLDEGIKVEVQTAAQAVWLTGSVSFEGDPYRTTGGPWPVRSGYRDTPPWWSRPRNRRPS